MKIEKKNPRHWLLLLQQGLYTLLASAARYLKPDTQKPLVILYGHQLSGNLKALYDEWNSNRRRDFDCYFLSLDPLYSQKLRDEQVQVLQCCRLRDMIMVGRSNVIITDHGLHAMRPFLSLTDIYFIDVWHGIPYKGFTPDNFRVQHRYHEIWVSSPKLKQVYEGQYGFSSKKVIDLGYARVDKLFRGDTPPAELRSRMNIGEMEKLVLYAPTWQQDDKGRELFPFGKDQDTFIQLLSELCARRTATLVIRSHLNASIGASTNKNVRYCSMKDFPDTEALLQHTDILICDWSSIAFDYLALNRPTIFLDVDPPFANGFSLGREYRFGKIVNNMESLCETLDRTLENPQWYQSSQNTLHEKISAAIYGENVDGGVAGRQLLRLAKLATHPHK